MPRNLRAVDVSGGMGAVIAFARAQIGKNYVTGGDGPNGLAQSVEAAAEQAAQVGCAGRTARVGVAKGLQVEQVANGVAADLEVGGESGQVAIELAGEGQERIPLVVQESAERVEAVRALRGASPQLGDEEIVHGLPFG